MMRGGGRPYRISIRKNGPEKPLELAFIQFPGLRDGLLIGVLDDDDCRSGGSLLVSGVAGKEAEEGPEAGRPPGVLFELEEDVPESALMADGGQVMPRGGGRWRWVGRRCIHMSRISEIGLVLNQFRHFP
jgi:hypothetical protein